MSRPIVITALCLAASTCQAQAETGDAALAPYEVRYEVDYSGLKGESTIALSRDETAGNWVIESVGSTRGIASLFVKKTPTQVTRFVVEENLLKPLDYSVEDGTDRTDHDGTVTFDWKAGEAIAREGDQTVELAIKPGTLSPVTADLALRMALLNGARTATFPVIEGLELLDYTYQPTAEEEQLDTPLGKFDTVKYRLDRGGSRRILVLWVAPDLQYLPVRLQQQKPTDDGKFKPVFTLDIQALSGIRRGT